MTRIEVKASCHCGRNTFKAPFATSSLPNAGLICHCNICRHSTGQLAAIGVKLDSGPLSLDSSDGNEIPASLDNLSVITSSSRGKRYFCSHCGAHMLFRHDHETHGT